ncbi:zinc finger protein ush [Adelges cooleyi]|uniref:zinc finger protein ush n=1 Tax=Adelges cooleyi TaxID=133065 RepID=UPI00217F2B3C|nr:zinc finger protein ush [Adelges cooleyi]
MSRRKQSNPKPLKPGEDNEWTNEEAGDDSFAKEEDSGNDKMCADVAADSKPSTPPVESPPVVETPKLRLNPNLATDPARRSPPEEPPPPNTTAEPTVKHNILAITATPRAIQIFICNPCGIRFSSLSTLDAHQTYYCSRRLKKDCGEPADDVKTPMVIVESAEDVLSMQNNNDADSRPSSAEPSAKSVRTGKQYKCPHCVYSADKKVSLNRHMRMHSISPVSVQSPPCAISSASGVDMVAAATTASATDTSSVVDRYCQNCDIRFSNLRTYQAHKTHYCNTRHVVKPTPSSSPVSLAVGDQSPPIVNAVPGVVQLPPPPPLSMPPTYLALPTNPVIVVPYSLVQNASVLSALSPDAGPTPPADTACILMSDGTLQPIAQALVPARFNVVTQAAADGGLLRPNRANSETPPEYYSPPKKIMMTNNNNNNNNSNNNNHINNGGHVREAKRDAAAAAAVVQSPSPLDLRLRPVSSGGTQSASSHDGEEEKENRRSDGNVTDAEDIVCAPSIPCMIMSPSSPPSGNKMPPHKLYGVGGQHNGVMVVPKGEHDVVFENAGAERTNGKFSVSSLLHVSNKLEHHLSNGREHVADGQPPASVVHHRQSYSHVAYKTAGRPVPGLLQQLSPAQRAVDAMINPAVLPYFTPEMTLRLANAANQVDGLPGAQQFFLKQGPSKCESCNIVFCKYENFLAHKRHYCASRPAQPAPSSAAGDSDDPSTAEPKTSPEGSPGPKPVTVSSPLSSKDSVSPTLTAHKPPMIQFICSTCGVRFSSFDNLTTHQSFYCPNRMAVAGPDHEKLLSKCTKCKMTVEANGHHQCQGAATNCWKCPVCGTVCPSASAAQKHLDNHNGIRAFVCTICQYKGNTLRGLRTHIRMHFNKRMIPDLMEEDYVTCVMDENSIADNNGRQPAGKTSPGVVDDADRPSAVVATLAAGNHCGDNGGNDENPVAGVIVKQEPNGGGTNAATDSGDGYEQDQPAGRALSDDNNDEDDGSATTAKYCKVCDISFNYLSTFIAHKKYYCRNSAEYKCKTENNAKTATVT